MVVSANHCPSVADEDEDEGELGEEPVGGAGMAGGGDVVCSLR